MLVFEFQFTKVAVEKRVLEIDDKKAETLFYRRETVFKTCSMR